ncbi:hypothetical protein [Maribacter ulvicola]|uniref:Uncharacterized protein n=1 Tax=Maribacter ulvicola TaxID=228959 RepID=A0A1N6YUW1_9FLAO|nr:hypothetical protein [Maribacter ulvicola]SIR18366.1 hypothetical protein SAMN05421797_107156 [Maribacter ulvicola]
MKLPIKILLGILTCTLIALYWFSNQTEGEYYRRHSPDGQYSIYASRNKYFNLDIAFSNFGDKGGKIHLYDELENKIIGTASIAMISNINEWFWSEEELHSKGSIINIKLPRKISTKTINKYNKSLPVKDSWNLFNQGKQYKVEKISHRKLKVSDENGKILLQDIEHISQINNGFQVLNKSKEIAYYDLGLNKLQKAPPIQKEFSEICGNVNTYGFRIEENEKYFLIKKAVGFTNYSFNDYKIIDAVSIEKVKDIYFLNKKRELTFDANFLEKEDVVIDFGTYFGILSNQYGIQYFDSIDLSKNPIKVMRNKLYGYYNITQTQYLDLQPFEFNLAKFKKRGPDGEIMVGFVDNKGNKHIK